MTSKRLRNISIFHIFPQIEPTICFGHVLSIKFAWMYMMAIYTVDLRRKPRWQMN